MRGAGFSLLEMVIVLSIVGLITGISLVRYNQSSSQTVLSNLAYDIALTIRQAQVFGIAVREADTGTGQFPVYGVHLGTPPITSMILFADYDQDGVYDGPLENVKVYNFSAGYAISAMCGTYTLDCQTLTNLDIGFVRPQPEAILRGTPGLSGPYTSATLTVSNPHGAGKIINVYANGQISVP